MALLASFLLVSLAPAPAAIAQSPAGFPRVARDADRGLAPDFRARLALADARNDDVESEAVAARLTEQLAELSARWSKGDLQVDARPVWLSADLRARSIVPRFEELPASSAEVPPASARAARIALLESRPDEAAPSAPLEALAAWRARFDGDSRLDFEVREVESLDSTTPQAGPRATLRVVATGIAGSHRVQEEVEWLLRLEASVEGSAKAPEFVWRDLISRDARGAASLHHARGLFDDALPSLVDAGEYAAQIAPGLEHWSSILATDLEPGSLGHHGVAVGDVNGDGREDVYWCRPGGLPNRLFLHGADGRLIDAGPDAGVDILDYSSNALLLELDNDGDLDLVVATGEGLAFFANDGAGHFESRLRYPRSLALSLAAADVDADGDLDLFACSYLSPYEKQDLPLPYHDANNGEANQLLRNDGEFRFVDATEELGLDENNRRFSLAAAFEDFDDDGDPDLYVANDFGVNNLYRNDGGRFVDIAVAAGAGDISAGMGVTWGDADGDGHVDLYVTNMHSLAGRRLTHANGLPKRFAQAQREALRHHAMGNTLLHNHAGKSFEDVSDAREVDMGRWGWGSVFIDFDNDGALDLFAPNGFVSGDPTRELDSYFWRQVILQSPADVGGDSSGYALGWRAVNRLVRQGWSWNGNERNVALWNRGDGHFVDVSAALGLDSTDDTRATARVDWDGDGDEDLLTTQRGGPMLRLWRNRSQPGDDWIAFVLQAESQRSAVGARVELTCRGGKTLRATLRCGEGFLAQSSSRLTFGLRGRELESLRVRWPDGRDEAFPAPARGAAYRLRQASGELERLPPAAPNSMTSEAPFAPSSVGSAVQRARRSLLPRPIGIPRLELTTREGTNAAVLGITPQGPIGTGQPLLLLVHSNDAPECVRQMRRLADAAATLRAGGVDQVLAIAVPRATAAGETPAWEACPGWPFAQSTASEEALSVLELIDATLHDHALTLTLPTAFVVDATGRLVAIHSGELDAAQLVADAKLPDMDPAQRRDAALPFPGRWWAAPPEGPEPALSARMMAHGLTRAAGEYALVQFDLRERGASELHYQAGLARQRQERWDDAIAQFREALRLDPSHSASAQALAAALHRIGAWDDALAAYRTALGLEPAHERTRLNLGYLHIAREDLTAARAEVAALRELKSPLAASLEAQVRAAEQRKR